MTLLERLALATGPSRELDAEIARALGWMGVDPIKERGDRPVIGGGFVWDALPHFTGSIDAAMTLIPEGWFWEVALGVMGSNGTTGPYWVTLYPKSNELTEKIRYLLDYDEELFVGAPTPALALCSAAIQAIEMMGKK